MPKEILMPELAESVVEGEILKWLVEEGDYLKKDQPFVEVMTDKVTTVRRENVGTRVVRLAPESLVEVERALMAFLGLAR